MNGILGWIKGIEEVADATTPDGWRPGDAVPGGTDDIAFHPLANLFPLIQGAEFDTLVADVRANGLCEPIILSDEEGGVHRILDGRNRYRACRAAAMPLTFSVIAKGIDPLAFVLSRNLHRRHLNESQRALIAAKLATMRQGGDRRSLDQTANLRVDPPTQAEAAQLLHVSERSVLTARTVVEAGAPELQRAVEAGEVSVAAAAEITARTPAEQATLLSTLPRDEAGRLTPEAQTAVRRVAGELRAERTAEKKARREERERDLAARQQALPDKRYGVILADCEWRFEPYSRETGMDRSPDNHYPTSGTLDLITRPVGSIAAQDCVLFMWATAPMLPQALQVMATWGFAYKSHLVWAKTRGGGINLEPQLLERLRTMRPRPGQSLAELIQEAADTIAAMAAPPHLARGTGYWAINAHELLLIGVKGNIPAPAPGTQVLSVIEAALGEHSAKPERFLEIIEQYFPNLAKIELNRRGPPRPGWDAWGWEAEVAHGSPQEPPAPPPAQATQPEPSAVTGGEVLIFPGVRVERDPEPDIDGATGDSLE